MAVTPAPADYVAVIKRLVSHQWWPLLEPTPRLDGPDPVWVRLGTDHDPDERDFNVPPERMTEAEVAVCREAGL